MPTYSGYSYGFWELDPKQWAQCQQEVSAQMIAEGWWVKAGKFDCVMRKRARKLYETRR